MPRRDGTGPAGGGQSGAGRGRMGGPAAAGVQGYCVCPKCGNRIKHDRAQPCNAIKCPKCNTLMARE